MLDLECFVISGLKADQTSAAIMAFTFTERHKKEAGVGGQSSASSTFRSFSSFSLV